MLNLSAWSYAATMLNLLILSYAVTTLRLTDLMLLLSWVYCCDNAEITWSNAATMLSSGSTPSCLGLASSSMTTSDLTSLWETPGGMSLPKQRRHQFSTSLHWGCSKENLSYEMNTKNQFCFKIYHCLMGKRDSKFYRPSKVN